MTHPDTPELDGLDDIDRAFNDVRTYSTVYDHGRISHSQLVDKITEAKAALTRLLAKRELEGRIEELKRDRSHFATTDRYYGARLARLREELAKYE